MSDLPVPDYPGPMLVISRGRSGSTYLQRLLNCIENVYIFGENEAILRDLRHTYVYAARVAEAAEAEGALVRDKAGFETRFIAWARPYSLEYLLGVQRDYLEALFRRPLPQPESAVWGFKEIRLTAEDVRFFRTLYPGAKVIALHRDFGGQFLSTMRAWNRGRKMEYRLFLQHLRQHYSFHLDVATLKSELKQDFFTVNYADISDGPIYQLRAMCGQLGLDFDRLDQAKVAQVREARPDYYAGGEPTSSERALIGKWLARAADDPDIGFDVEGFFAGAEESRAPLWTSSGLSPRAG